MKTVSASYETDFYAWTQMQAGFLRSGAISELVLKDSPSLRVYADGVIGEAFEDALEQATDEMGYLTSLKQTFTTTYTLEQAMSQEVTL